MTKDGVLPSLNTFDLIVLNTLIEMRRGSCFAVAKKMGYPLSTASKVLYALRKFAKMKIIRQQGSPPHTEFYIKTNDIHCVDGSGVSVISVGGAFSFTSSCPFKESCNTCKRGAAPSPKNCMFIQYLADAEKSMFEKTKH